MERAVVDIKATVQSITLRQQVTADKRTGSVAILLKNGRQGQQSYGNYLSIFFNAALKRIGGGEQAGMRRKR